MNRIEIVGLFTAMETLADEDNLEGLKKIIKAVLDEARTKSDKSDKSDL